VPAFVIASVTIEDPVRYEQYKQMVPATLTPFGGRFVARGGHMEVLEGMWRPGRLVILEFPSVERARAWWNSPAYAPARDLRQATSTGTLLIVEGL
jgi:uncharacterized protein (DUF1330 family)